MYNDMYDGYYNSSKTLRPTKSNIEMFIANSIQVNYATVKFNDVSERPSIWKHACVQTGVTALNEGVLNFYNVAKIYYVVCPMCNKINYYVEE